MAHDEIPTNPTSNRPFADVVQSRLQRRTVLAGGVALAATTILAGNPAGATAAVEPKDREERSRNEGEEEIGRESDEDFDESDDPEGVLIGFTAIDLDDGKSPVVSPDYQWSVLAPWGTPLKRRLGDFTFPLPSAEEQENRVGPGHDGMWFFSLRRQGRSRRGLLCINHEFGTNQHLFGLDNPDPTGPEQVAISQAAHGVSVIEVRQTRRGQWEVVPGRRSHRIHVNSRVGFSGPAAKSDLLDNPAGNRPRGTVNNCANGYTPWGTYLTCEENFNGYFGATGEFTPTEAQERYGFSEEGFNYGWEDFDPRFDLTDPDYANEQHRFGWVVEIDPYYPRRQPVKRTALGRFKHEGIALTVGKDRRAVGYMGDDQRFDYIYKFVSDDNYRRMLRRGRSPLDHGKLYVARFDEDGTGEWLELTIDNPVLSEAFADQAEVLIFARQAADILGATPMDRPEWTTVGPDGDVFCTLTNNSRREEPNAPNPQAPNPDGHILRFRDDDDHVGTTFEWDVFLLASDTQGTDAAFGSPDGLWADPDGRLFIQTDGGQPNDAEENKNDQMLVADPATGDLRRIFSGVAGAEVTGIAVTPDRRTMFINLQHPGGSDGDPELTTFPDLDNGVVPRDATIVLTRKDGGIIGS